MEIKQYVAIRIATEAGTITTVLIQPVGWSTGKHGIKTILKLGTLEECKAAVREAGLAEKFGYNVADEQYFDARVHKTPKKTLVLEGR